MKRREFIEFLGTAGLMTAGGYINLASGRIGEKLLAGYLGKDLPIQPLLPVISDELALSQGLSYHVIAAWGDPISDKDSFGTHCDYTAFLPDPEDPNKGHLWVNHEYLNPMFISGYDGIEKTKAMVDKERYSVGGSFIKVEKKNGVWKMLKDDSNLRLTASTPIDIAWHEPIAGSMTAIGTLANCSGGVTPWGTILTCEENYDGYYGEAYWENGTRKLEPGYMLWEEHYDLPPEHYGWVVEFNPATGKAKKIIAMGRCRHECATPYLSKDGKLVVYTGDDKAGEHLYKFVSDHPDKLDTGKLYVANLEWGEWIPVDYETQPELQEHFESQTEVLIRLPEAAKILKATPLDRPEDIDIDPVSGDVFVTLTNNKAIGNYHGSVLKIREHSEDKTGTEFRAEVFMAGGKESGFSCPDNMAFDPAGNLWITCDVSGSKIGKGEYEPFGNNGLHLVLRSGPNAGKVIQVASAPMDAELTGPYFSPDGRTLFLSVQHPGEQSGSLDDLTSHWPEGGESIPKSAVVAITGPALDRLMGLDE